MCYSGHDHGLLPTTPLVVAQPSSRPGPFKNDDRDNARAPISATKNDYEKQRGDPGPAAPKRPETKTEAEARLNAHSRRVARGAKNGVTALRGRRCTFPFTDPHHSRAAVQARYEVTALQRDLQLPTRTLLQQISTTCAALQRNGKGCHVPEQITALF